VALASSLFPSRFTSGTSRDASLGHHELLFIARHDNTRHSKSNLDYPLHFKRIPHSSRASACTGLNMRLPSGLNWLPAKIYAIDADTQKPIDPNVGRKMQVTYYDIKKNKDGSKSMVAHKSPKPSEHGGSGKAEKVSSLRRPSSERRILRGANPHTQAKKDGNDGKGGKDEKKANGGNENQVSTFSGLGSAKSTFTDRSTDGRRQGMDGGGRRQAQGDEGSEQDVEGD